jgi:hypothetical protein
MQHKSSKSKLGWDFDSTFKVSERELVKPKLSRWDKEDLYNMLMEDLTEFVKVRQIAPYNQMKPDQFLAEVEKIFPKYMLYDTYNINETPTEAMEIAETDENNQWLFDFLMNKATDYYMKAITQNSPHNSYVYASEIVQQLLLLYQQQNPQGPGNDGEGTNGKGQSGMEKMLSKMMGDKSGNQQLDQAMQQAQKNAQEQIEKAEAQGEATGELGSDKSLGDFSLGELAEFMNYQDAMKHIRLDGNLVDNFIKTTLNLSKTYFSTKYKEFQLEMLEADVIDDLQGLENLHPQLRALHLDQVVTHDRYYHMKFDVYFDISGSMDSKIYGYTENANGSQTRYSVSGLDMAKITAIKLRNLGYVEDVYPFESRVHPKLDDNHKIALVRCTGGTSIDEVVRNVKKTGRPSVVITDMEDTIYEFDSNVYFIGILSANFGPFKRTPAGKQYVENRQCVQYTGENAFVTVT